MSDIPKIQPYSLPVEFVAQWNDAAEDSMITANEYRAIQEVAKATATTEDDRFLADLNESQLEAVAAAARNAGLLFSEIGAISSDTIDHRRWSEYLRTTDEPVPIVSRVHRFTWRAGVNGGAIGYSSQKVRVGDASFGRFHGVHTDVSLSHPALRFGLLHASFRVEADLGFGKDGAILVAGAGPMIYVGVPGLAQLYGGVLANGVVGSVADEGRAGWAVSATAGGQVFLLYAETDYPVTGGNTRPAGFSIGLRAGF